MKRQRGRNRNKNSNNRNHNNNNHNRSMDSQGPDVKVRGNAATIYEKYTTLARDAKMGGSRVKAENLLQHAEHYLRVMNVQEAAKKLAQEAREKADAERAAKRAERGETDNENDGENSRDNNRRNHRNSRRDGGEARNKETAETPTELDVIEPVAEAPKETIQADTPEADMAEDKPVRRRKAPARKKAAAEPPVEAAE